MQTQHLRSGRDDALAAEAPDGVIRVVLAVNCDAILLLPEHPALIGVIVLEDGLVASLCDVEVLLVQRILRAELGDLIVGVIGGAHLSPLPPGVVSRIKGGKVGDRTFALHDGG